MSNNYGLCFTQYVAIQGNQKLYNKLLEYHSKKSNAYKGMFPRNDCNAIGRQKEIEDIKQTLQKDKIIVVTGISGMGKTALIKYYAWYNQTYYQHNLYYIDCQNDEIFKKDFTKIAKHLKVPTKKYDNQRSFQTITKETFNILKSKIGLLVFDNVDNLQQIEQYLEPDQRVEIIISGRQVNSGGRNCLHLKPIPEDSALVYFEHLFEDQLLKELDRPEVKRIGGALKCVPLALKICKMQIMERAFRIPSFKLSIYVDDVLTDTYKEGSLFLQIPETANEYELVIYKMIRFELQAVPNQKIIQQLCSLNYLNPSFITIKCWIRTFYLIHSYSEISRSGTVTKYYNPIHVLATFTINNNYVEVNYYARKLAWEYANHVNTVHLTYHNVLSLITLHNYPEHHKYIFSFAKDFVEVFKMGFGVSQQVKLLKYLTTYGCLTSLEVLFESEEYSTNFVQQNRLLEAAVNSGCIKTVQFIYKYDNNIKRINDKGHTLVWQAIENNHTVVLDFLISKGASLEYADKLNKTPLHRAAFLGRLDILKLLLSKGVDPNIRNKFQRTPLHYAAMEGHNDIIQELLNHPKININARDHYRRSPVFETVRCCQLDCLKMFIENGARIQTKDNLDLSPVRLAKLQQNRDDILEVFKEYGYKEDTKNEVCCLLCNIEIM